MSKNKVDAGSMTSDVLVQQLKNEGMKTNLGSYRCRY